MSPPSPGRYPLGQLISSGGMGDVYRATDTVLNRDVAVKVVKSRYATDSRVARRFEEEARITAQLQHPAIPPVHDLGTLPDGRPYLAMKLIKGETLESLLAARTSPADERGRFVAAFEQVCQALAYAHAHNVIHRDLKPANVMVGSFGEVQVMDWGLAKVLGERPRVTGPSSDEPAGTAIQSLRDADLGDTQSGAVMGTLAYMPPEQAIGAIDQIDARSDVFGLGGILAAILTGRPPLVGPDSERTRQMAAKGQVQDCFARLDASGADPELVALCKRCLAPEKADRPANGGEAATAVAALRAAADERARQAELDRVKVEGERAAAEVKAVEQRKRARVRLMLIGAVGLLFAGVGAFAWWRQDQRSERRHAEARLEGERDAQARAKASQADQGVTRSLRIAPPLRKTHKYEEAGAALAQALELATGGAPERLAEVEQARSDLALVVKLDAARYRKFIWIPEPGGKGAFKPLVTAPEYRKTFADHGLDLVGLPPEEAVRRVAASGARAELVAAVDDWTLFETDAPLRERLLGVARLADPGKWTNRLRDPAVRTKPAELQKLAAEANSTGAAPEALTVLATLMERQNLDPSALLRAARSWYPSEFDLAFAAGQWHARKQDGQEVGPYEAALALRPKNCVAWMNLGKSFYDKGDVDGAFAAYTKAAEAEPTLAVAQYCVGVALRDKSDPAGAIAQFRRAIALDPKFVTARVALGTALVAEQDLDGAVAEFRRATALDPGEVKAHYNMGIVLHLRKDLDGSVATLTRALEIDPKKAEAHAALGAVLHDKGDRRGAVAALKRSIELDPKVAKVHFNLGLVLRAAGDRTGAATALRRALQLDPKHATAHTALGTVLRAGGDLDAAIDEYHRAIACDPKLAAAHYSLGVALGDKKNLDGSVAAFMRALELDPNDAATHSALASTLRAKGDATGAIAALRRAIQLDPKFATAHFGLGLMLSATGDPKGAIESLRTCVGIDPRYSGGYYTLGVILMRQKDPDGAIAAYRKAAEYDPKCPGLHFNLGLALVGKGDADGAITAYRTAIEFNPVDAEAHCNLGLLLQRQKRTDEALLLLKRGHELGSKRSGWNYPSARWVADCEKALAAQLERTAPPPRAVNR